MTKQQLRIAREALEEQLKNMAESMGETNETSFDGLVGIAMQGSAYIVLNNLKAMIEKVEFASFDPKDLN